MARDVRTAAVVEALVLEGVLGSGRAAAAAEVVDRVLVTHAPQVFVTRRRNRLPEAIGHAGLLLAVVAGQLAVLDEATDSLGYTILALTGVGSFLQYVVRPAGGYLLVAVTATTLVVPQLSADLTGGTLGAGGAWLMAGMALLGSVLVAWRLRQERPASGAGR